MSNDDTVVKQYPYDAKAEQTASGVWKISAHAYGESLDQVATDLPRLVSMIITEMETKGYPLLVNTGEIVKKEKAKK